MNSSGCKVLVCGGAGYIGSHIVCELNKLPADKFQVVVLDNLTKGKSVTHACDEGKRIHLFINLHTFHLFNQCS